VLPEPRPRAAGEDLPGGGQSLLPADALSAFFAGNYGPNKELSQIEIVDVEGGPVDRALRITVGDDAASDASEPWHAEIKTRQIAPTTGGDVAHLRFFARTIESEHETGAGEVNVYYQHAGRPFDPSFMFQITPTVEWQRYDIPFEVFRTYGEGTAELNFAAGSRPQVVEIAGVELINFGQDGVELAELPKTSQDYEGRDPDAQWRKDALARIEEHRVSPLQIKVVDSAGNEIKADVEVKMTNSSFQFGSAINAEQWSRTDADGERYRQETLRLFNTASTENGLKIHRWYDEMRRAETMAMLKDLDAAGMYIHGHVLVWPSWAKTRIDTTEIRAAAEAGNVEPLREMTNQFIVDATTGTEDYVDAWDVMNEPWNNNDFMKLLGYDEMAKWFELARKHAGDKMLFINDFGILTDPVMSRNEHAREYHRVIQVLIDDNAPLDAIGFQSHFGQPIAPVRMMEMIEEFRPFGKRMMVTEFDARTNDQDAYADFMRDLLIITYADEAFDGFIMWGFWDEPHWLKNAPLYDEDWNPKAGLAMWEKWVLNEWRTHEQFAVDGTATVRGHHGSYEVTATANGKTTTQTLELDGPQTVTLTLE
jgi:GH35 family endo-1,4-beta-xylanase